MNPVSSWGLRTCGPNIFPSPPKEGIQFCQGILQASQWLSLGHLSHLLGRNSSFQGFHAVVPALWNAWWSSKLLWRHGSRQVGAEGESPISHRLLLFPLTYNLGGTEDVTWFSRWHSPLCQTFLILGTSSGFTAVLNWQVNATVSVITCSFIEHRWSGVLDFGVNLRNVKAVTSPMLWTPKKGVGVSRWRQSLKFFPFLASYNVLTNKTEMLCP